MKKAGVLAVDALHKLSPKKFQAAGIESLSVRILGTPVPVTLSIGAETGLSVTVEMPGSVGPAGIREYLFAGVEVPLGKA